MDSQDRMKSFGSLVSVIDEFGNVTGPYLYVDSVIPIDSPNKYDYSAIVGSTNMRYYVLMRGEKIVFVLGGWGTLIPFENGGE